jgi:selenoprotein W-related protein
VSLTAEILKEFESQITSLELIPSSGGAFEVEVDGELIYSKKAEGRHPVAAEIKNLIRPKLNR